MKCAYSPNEVALYIEGDLPADLACEVQAHLTSCAVCRDIAAELRESQTMLKSLRQDAVSPTALASVRSRVFEEIRAETRPVWGRWVYAVAGTVFVAILGVGLATYVRIAPDVRVQQLTKTDELANPLLTKEEPREAPGLSPTPEVPAKVTTPASPRAARARPPLLRKEGNNSRLETPPTSPDPSKQLVVKLLTDDPKIVIYWLVDQPGGSL
jgi:hypothetical protein